MDKKLFALLLGLAPMVGFADVVPVEKAEDVAAHFFHIDEEHTHRSANQSLKLVWKGMNKTSRGVSNAPTFYVFNHGNHQGFVIISGEDAVEPVLAYSDKGTFGTENMPDNLKGWTQYIDQQINEIRQLDLQATSEVAKAWKDGPNMPEKVVELYTPEWDQDEPYNWQCPPFDEPKENRKYTGCAITAAAEVMAYYQWPDKGVGTIKEHYSEGTYLQYLIPEIQLGESYQWKKMPLINGNKLNLANEEQGNAVAKLMFHLGAMSNASYDLHSTGATYEEVSQALVNHMKYQSSLIYLYKFFFSETLWKKMIREELDKRRPILYQGFTEESGHGFVCDGYDKKDKFHINWGWSGYSNGYYKLDNLDPSIQGAGSSTGGYNDLQAAVFRVQPQYEGVEREHVDKINFVNNEKIFIPSMQLSDPNIPIETGQPFDMSIGCFMNFGTDCFNGDIRLVVTDMKGEAKEVILQDRFSIETSDGIIANDDDYPYITITLEEPFEAGDRIRMQYRWENQTEWKTITCEPTEGNWEIVLKGDMAVKTTASTNIPDHALATFSAPVNVTPSDPSVEAYYAEQKDDATITMKKIEPVNGRLVLPANTGVMLSTSQATSFTMEPSSDSPAIVPSTNLLQATTEKGVTVDTNVNAYIMGMRNNQISFHTLSKAYRTIAANRAYLVLPTNLQPTKMMMSFDEMTTGIKPMEVYEESHTAPLYDLTGRKVITPQRGGIYIRNGKKIIIK